MFFSSWLSSLPFYPSPQHLRHTHSTNSRGKPSYGGRLGWWALRNLDENWLNDGGWMKKSVTELGTIRITRLRLEERLPVFYSYPFNRAVSRPWTVLPLPRGWWSPLLNILIKKDDKNTTLAIATADNTLSKEHVANLLVSLSCFFLAIYEQRADQSLPFLHVALPLVSLVRFLMNQNETTRKKYAVWKREIQIFFPLLQCSVLQQENISWNAKQEIPHLEKDGRSSCEARY